ncbi:hypothetical protein PUN28_014284 [Cardiocondyla obscurior]|uniref:Uncharacterized protein n=1 Tax=Cardiocondyla obscurior TaxID=286306 RepID=A0AAW2F388_9HYME
MCDRNIVYRRIFKFFGHIVRHDIMEKLMVKGRPKGKKKA